MNKFNPFIWVVLITSCSIFLYSCAYIETKRYAEINHTESSILFEVSGFYSAPLTPEGPFPHWSNSLKVILKSEKKIPKTGSHLLKANQEFETQYGEVESGVIILEPEKNQVEVNVKYIESYSWNRVNGNFSIKDSK